MPRPAQLSKAKLTDRLTEIFLDGGFDGASLADLAKATGLSKASLYHHFPGGKADMAGYVMARMGAKLQSGVIQPLLAKGNAQDRVARSLAATKAYYAGDRPTCLLNILGIGAGYTLFAPKLRDGIHAWISSLAQALTDGGIAKEEAQALAEAAICRIQGALILCRVEDSRAPLDRTVDALDRELSAALAE